LKAEQRLKQIQNSEENTLEAQLLLNLVTYKITKQFLRQNTRLENLKLGKKKLKNLINMQ